MLLTATQKIQVVLTAAVATVQLPVVANWADIPTDASTLTPGGVTTATNGVTAVDVVAAPAAGFLRQLKYLSVFNADTAAATVTIRVDDAATVRIAVRVNLAVGSRLEYVPGTGFRVTDSSGGQLTTTTGGGSGTVPTGTGFRRVVSGVEDAAASFPTKAEVGLGNADNTSDANKPVSTAQAAADNLRLTTADVFADFVVSGLLSPTSANLSSTLAAGSAYVLGTRVTVGATAFTYAASQDTYVDLSNAGVLTYLPVANGAAAPTLTANSLRLQRVVTNATAVTTVTRLAILKPLSVSSSGNVEIGAASSGARVSVAEKLRLFDVTPTNAFSSTDAGYLFSTNINSGMISEASGEILSYAINVAQVGTRDTTRVGGIFRLDSRVSEQYLILFGSPTGTFDFIRRLSVNLQNGETSLVPNGGGVAVGLALATAVLHLKAGTATANTAPIKLTSGPLNTVAVAGQIEYDNNWWLTDSTPTRRRVESTNFTAAVFSITPPASTVAYQNATGYPLDVLITGGTVSAIEFSRDGTAWFAEGIIAGKVHLSPLDRVRVTYTAAPTMTGIPR